MQIDPNAVQWDAAPQIPVDSVQWDEPPKAKNKFDLRGEGFDRLKNYSPTNTLAGLVRGAGSIGATLVAPFDYAEDKLTGLIAGPQAGPSRNEQRRADMDGGLQLLGADPTSQQFKNNKLIAEAAGASGVGPAAGTALSAIPAVARNAPALVNAIRTGGMATGAPAGASRIADMGVRVAGGAVSGGLTAGAVNPEDAGTGMMIGGGFPVVTKALGAAGDALGSLFKSSAPTLNPTKLQTARESMDAGYVIPPSMVRPSLKNRVLESTSGKQATAQIAATRNQAISEDLTRQSLNLPADAPLNKETMMIVRKEAGKVYAQAKNAGQIAADPAYFQALDDVASTYKTAAKDFPSLGPTNMHGKPIDVIGDMVKGLKVNKFDSSSAIDGISVLRDQADKAFLAGDKTLGKASKDAASAMEAIVERHLQATGQSELYAAFKEARKTIAKSYTAEKAIREGSGTVDARAFARELQKGKPLEGAQLKIAKFANTFDKAAQPPHLIGSPAVHNLSSMFSTGAGAAGAGAGAMIGGPAGAAVGATLGAAYPYVVPPLVRSRMFSKGAQQNLLNQGASQPGLLSQSLDELLPMMYRTSPLLAGRGG